MTLSPGLWWLRWLPADSRAGIWRRGLIVWAVALLIAVAQWVSDPGLHAMPESLVYSFGISTGIWFITDPLRIALHRFLGAAPPHYWRTSPRMFTYLLLGAVAGYALGTALGNAYSGRSTWQVITLSPGRFVGFLLFSLGVSLAFLYVFYQRARTEDLERLSTETRLKLLESQLEPHMLFNTLANLRVLIGTDPARATAMLDQLGDYLRATLAASRSDGGHPLALEFQRLRDYLGLMSVRMGERLRYTLDLPDDLARHPVPPLLLQPLVENAIRHGLEPALQGGAITVTARREGNALRITVQDTGVGFDGDPKSGFGLTQVRERLATAFGAAARLDWTSATGQGTRITLTLPLQERPE